MAAGPGSGRLPFLHLVGRFLLAVMLSAVLLAPTAGASVRSGNLEAFGGLGTWLDYHAGKSVWGEPERTVAAMARDGARTLYLQTGNYRQSVDVIRRRAQGRFIDAAHAAGLRVVAWYLPSFASPREDERRALAAIRFQSPDGERFDAFALDIEATTVRGLALRDRRLLELSARLRSTVGPDYPLGAITPSPIGMSPYYWPQIPYRGLARFYDVFLPMAYSTMKGVQGGKNTRAYLAATVAAVRTGTGDPDIPVHLIGGLSGSMGNSETGGFMRAVADCNPLGYSLYSFPTTHRETWTALAGPVRTHTSGKRACGRAG